MPRLTINLDGKTHDLPDGTVPHLQLACDRNNAAANTALPLGEWLALHLQEIAIAPELGAAIDQLRKQQEADANAALTTAIATARDELLATLAGPAIAGSEPE